MKDYLGFIISQGEHEVKMLSVVCRGADEEEARQGLRTAAASLVEPVLSLRLMPMPRVFLVVEGGTVKRCFSVQNAIPLAVEVMDLDLAPTPRKGQQAMEETVRRYDMREIDCAYA